MSTPTLDPQETPLFTSMSAGPILAAGGDSSDDGFHAPGLEEFFPTPILGDGQWFTFDRIMMVRLIMAAVLILFVWLAVRRPKVVPGKLQSLFEMGVDFVRVQIGEQILGKERARPFIGMLVVIFFTILVMNLAGIIPFLNIGGTSRPGLPLLLALWVFVTYLAAGIKVHAGTARKHGAVGAGAWARGTGSYLKTQLFPPGVPWPVYIILTPIEALQVFVLRPATLTIRLVANMIAGHLMLVLCFAATDYLLSQMSAVSFGAALSLAGGIFITVFEIFVSVLQAYIFTLLAAIYLNFAMEEEH